MKKLLFSFLAIFALAACSQEPADIYIPKDAMEFAGNGFETFALGADVRVYMSPDQDDPKQWNIQAVVPVVKEAAAELSSMDMELTLLDDQGIRVRESFSLSAEDTENLVPVFNGDSSVESSVVFSIPEVDGTRKRFPFKQAKAMLDATKGGRLGINVVMVEKKMPEEVPNTLSWLCKKTGVNGLLAQYRRAVKKNDLRKAGEVEAKIYKIEKDVKKNKKYPEKLRKSFIDYVEGKIEDIDDGK